MYSDYEVECWYLGKPFQEEASEDENIATINALSDEEADRIFLGLPFKAA